jgi:hypothetical protein
MCAGTACAEAGRGWNTEAESACRKLSRGARKKLQQQLGLGLLYEAFDDHKEGLEACAAVEALIEISKIETLRSSFLLPLQGTAVKAEVPACVLSFCALVLVALDSISSILPLRCGRSWRV